MPTLAHSKLNSQTTSSIEQVIVDESSIVKNSNSLSYNHYVKAQNFYYYLFSIPEIIFLIYIVSFIPYVLPFSVTIPHQVCIEEGVFCIDETNDAIWQLLFSRRHLFGLGFSNDVILRYLMNF